MSQNNSNREVTGGERTAGQHTAGRPDGASAVDVRTPRDDHPAQEALIGSDDVRRSANISWGAIFAGTVTFLALTLLLNIATAAMGLQGASGAASGIWGIIALAIALAAGGYIAGALAVRAGLLHGFLTWATSILAVVLLAGWLGSSLLGAVGGVVGNVAETVAQTASVSSDDAQDAADSVSEEDVDDAQATAEAAVEDASDEVSEASDDIASGAWWAFAGALIGAALAALTGAAGARSVINRDKELAVEHRTVGRR